MPYSSPQIGIYKIVNTVTGQCYVGQSQNLRKRVAEHFRLLRKNIHTNPKLQNSFNKYGENAFTYEFEVICEDTSDLDALENAFLKGDACFVEPVFFNIANEAKVPMRGKKHTEETRKLISKNRRASSFDPRNLEHRKKLSDSITRYYLSDEKHVEKIRFIVNNPDMTYAARGRVIGLDTSSTRKLALKYQHLKGVL